MLLNKCFQNIYLLFTLIILFWNTIGDRRGRDRSAFAFTTTYAIGVITTNVESSNPAQAKWTRYNIML
jgi:hypothetical protein